MDSWDSFIYGLDQVDWNASDEKIGEAVTRILRTVAGRNHIWQERLEYLVDNQAEYRELESYHNFPRLLMDKLVIYRDPADRYRVRLHRFNALKNTGGAKERIHSHKWLGYTLILKGTLCEELFSIREMDLEKGYAKIDLIQHKQLSEGMVDIKEIGIPHRVINDDELTPAYTLFVRGPSRERFGIIFDEELSTCWKWLGADEALKKGFKIFQDLSDDFI